MKRFSILLSSLLTLLPALAGNTEWWIDFGRSEVAGSYGAATNCATRTTEAGWNNVAVATQTEAGAASLSSSYFAETVEIDSTSVVPTYAQQAANAVPIYDTGNNVGSALTLSISKNTGTGTFEVQTTANAPADKLFNGTPRPEWVPTRAYGDYIMTYLNNDGSGAFTLVLSGFEPGFYDFTVIAGGNSYLGSVYEGYDASAIYTLNGTAYTLTGTNASGGGYAGVMEWKGVEIQENGSLSMTVEGGYLGMENGVGKYTSAVLNTMIIQQVPEPATTTLSLLTLAALAARRRRK